VDSSELAASLQTELTAASTRRASVQSAAFVARSFSRPTVVSPSDISTIRPGGGAWLGSLATEAMAPRLARDRMTAENGRTGL